MSASLGNFTSMYLGELLIETLPNDSVRNLSPISVIEIRILSRRMIAISILLSRTEELHLVSSSLRIFAAIHPSGLLIGPLPSDVRNLLNIYWSTRLPHWGKRGPQYHTLQYQIAEESYEGFLIQALKLAFGNSDITSARHLNRRNNDGLDDGSLSL